MFDCSSYINDRYIFHHNRANWGFSLLIMEKHGKAFARLYQYDDEDDTVYLDWLSVDPEARKQGIGTELQVLRENIGRKLGATMACLWVEKDSWMHHWYKRRAYKDWKDYENEENAVWMRKILTFLA